MSEFKAKTMADTFSEIEAANVNEMYDSRSFKGGCNWYGYNYYAPLLKEYTTTRAELATVKAELDRGKWVSVSEGKPTILEDGESESVLACTRIPLGPKGEYEHHILIAYVKYTNKGWIWREDGKPVANIITHWQPLPTPPHKN